MPLDQASNNNDVLTPASKGLDNLFKTLIILQRQLTPLFSNEVAQFDAIQLQELEEFYHTVSDRNGVLSLQLKNSSAMRTKINFLNAKEMSSLLKDYVPGVAVGAVSGLAVAGLCIEATVETSAAVCATEGLIEGAMMGARVLNPWFIVPSVVLMSTSWFSSYMSRKLSFTIIRALELYNEAKNSDDKQLIEAEKILKEELGEGVNGRYKVSRAVRYPSTSKEQFDFMNLLLAQIHLKKELAGCYEEFQKVIDQSTNKSIKGMALIGQIDMLSPTSRWTFYKQDTTGLQKEAMTVAERMELLYPKAEELNRSHRELVELYFNRIWDAYNSMLAEVEGGVCLRSPDEFLEQQIAINKMINFQGVHVLRYMGDNGQLAEILLNFIQAVSYVMHDVHNRYLKSLNDEGAVSDKRDHSTLAKKQFGVCRDLIGKYKRDSSSDKYDVAQDVFNIIRRFTEQYFNDCEASYGGHQRVNSPILHQWSNNPLYKLSHSEAEDIADKALRDEKKPSKPLRDAKVSFAKIKHNNG